MKSVVSAIIFIYISLILIFKVQIGDALIESAVAGGNILGFSYLELGYDLTQGNEGAFTLIKYGVGLILLISFCVVGVNKHFEEMAEFEQN
jgi:hypothetical protein